MALKRTVGNNWVHVSCAVWMPEVRFGDVEMVDEVECIGLIDRRRWSQVGSAGLYADKQTIDLLACFF